VHLIDQTKKIRAWLRKLERWIKKLPIKAFMRWHIKWLSDHIEANIWRKHPDWICFIVGYLVAAAMSAYTIHDFASQVRATPPKTIPDMVLHALPTSIILSPIPAAVLGGMVTVCTRRLLRWGKRAKLILLYMAVVLWKGAITFTVISLLLFSVVKATLESPKANGQFHLSTDYLQMEITRGIFFWLICLRQPFILMNVIIYCFEYCLLLWVLSHVAIWITKAIRLLLKKADGMYCVGAVGALSAFAESMIQAYPYIAAIPASAWGWIQFYLGFGGTYY
jgi:hypothetical protein